MKPFALTLALVLFSGSAALAQKRATATSTLEWVAPVSKSEEAPRPPVDNFAPLDNFAPIDQKVVQVAARAQQKERAEDDAEPEVLPEPWPPMQALHLSVAPPAGKLPKDYATERPEPPAGFVLVRGWPTMTYLWAASGSRHYPLYFEEVNAERYGYGCRPCLQPVVSAAHFFGTIPYLPYLMAANCPRECVYTLGHYRPGSCNPWRPHSFPLSARGAAAEGLAVTGLILLIP